MKIAILYPPYNSNGLMPLLTQNRQFRFTHSKKVRIYPLVAASLATILNKNGEDVLFLDGINEFMSHEYFINKVREFAPDVIFLETKAPLLGFIRNFIQEIKTELSNIKIILFGDHVTYEPRKTFENIGGDYCVLGGDYDYWGAELVDAIKKNQKLPPSTLKWENNSLIGENKVELIKELDELPHINRELVNWRNYGEAYLYHPAIYILSGRGCGVKTNVSGICSFCIWQHQLWQRTARLHSPKYIADEIELLIKKYKIKEIFDDNESGALWNYEWLLELYKELNKRHLIGKFYLSSNARADSLSKRNIKLAKKIGYRLLKIGVESGSNKILKNIRKLESVEQIETGIKNAKDAGIITMLTLMTGYPEEGIEEVKETFNLAKRVMLYKTHFGDCLQASVIIPYPGTPLYEDAKKKGIFTIDPMDYSQFAMDKPILASRIEPLYWTNKLWKLHLHPLFILRSFFTIKSILDLKLAINGISSLLGHLHDFKSGTLFKKVAK